MFTLSEQDRREITTAIKEVEAETAAEIYCVLAHSSGDYHLVPLAWAALIALIAPLPLLYFTSWPSQVIYLAQLLAFGVGLLVLSVPTVRYWLVPRRVKHERAHAEAMRLFLTHGMQQTECRTGVLIFVSMAEHYAEIVADAGIAQRVDQEEWDQAIGLLIDGIKRNTPGTGFVAAIRRCKALLAAHFPPGSLNRNELPDMIVEV